jgi:hypothetical protein
MKKFLSFLACAALLVSLSNFFDSDDAVESSPATTSPAETVETFTIELVAGEKGEYGELITLNEGDEFEETYYVYRVPTGTYTVTNTGEYPGQFNVYGDTVYVTDVGWEELSDVFYGKLLDVGQSDTVEIGEGQIIEIHEPDHYTLVPVE